MIRLVAKMRPTLLRGAAASEDARVACPTHKPFSRFSASNASLPGWLLSPHVFSIACGGVLQRCGTLLRRAAASENAHVPLRHGALRVTL